MSDLISREAAIDAAMKDVSDKRTHDFNAGATRAANNIKTLPSVQPERIMGRWKPFDLTWGRSIYACSVCGQGVDVPTVMGTPIYRYCPHCGADMREEGK